MDFNSDSFNITINARAMEGKANISVSCDDEVEGLETFDMRLTLASSSTGVTLGRDTSVGRITDSTGNELKISQLWFSRLMFNSWGELQLVIIWSNGGWCYSDISDSTESNIISAIWSNSQYNEYNCYRYG